jgi:nucleotide-binding universal stress UspA family protein
MDRGLVVVTDDEASRDLLREAGELAGGVDAELLLLSIVAEEEFERDAETLEQIGDAEGTSYDESAILDAASSDARQIANEELDDLDVEYDSVGAIAKDDARDERIVEVAEKRECDYVFLVGRQRSPTGKALFGDTAQKVVLNFSGRVVLSMD